MFFFLLLLHCTSIRPFSNKANAWVSASVFHYLSNEAKPDPPYYERHFIFHLAFLIAYLRVLKLTSLIGKLKIWCKCTFRGCPITTNKPLANQIALRGRQKVSGQLLLPFQHLCVLPYFAIRHLTQPFLSQFFYCICCSRQTAIKLG